MSQNVSVSSGVIAGIAYAQDAFLEPALGLATGSNSSVEIQDYFLHDRALAAELATLNLFPPWRDEISLLVNASSNGIGEPFTLTCGIFTYNSS